MILYEYWQMDKALIFDFIGHIKEKYKYTENMGSRRGIKPVDVSYITTSGNPLPYNRIYVVLAFQTDGAEVWSDGLHLISKGTCLLLPDQGYVPEKDDIRLRISWNSEPVKHVKKWNIFDNKLLRKIKLSKLNI